MTGKFLTVIVLFFATTNPLWAGDDFQYWSQYSAKVVDGEKLDLVSFAELRFKEDASELGVYYFSERLIYEHSKHLTLGMNYTYFNTRPTAPWTVNDDFKFHHRLEWEFTPNYKFKSGVKMSMRNRLEYRWIEDQGSDNTRYRQRYTLEVPGPERAFFKSTYSSVEGFYNSSTENWNEAWIVPLGMNIPLNKKLTFTPYYMIQFQKGSADWSSNQIFGTLWSMSF